MKFGRNLPQSQVPEWAAAYIDYKGLKKLIKGEADRIKVGNDAQPDTAAFFFALDRNLEDIDSFYNKKFADAARRLKLLQDQYGRSQEDPTVLDRDEVEDLTSALLDLRSALRKLQWYGEVNRRGFVKITKKLDKKLGFPKGATQKPYNEAKVDLRPFAKDASILGLFTVVNEWLSKLGEVNSDEEGSIRPPYSLSRVPSRAKLNLPEDIADRVDTAIREDRSADLAAALEKVPGGPQDSAYHRLMLSLLTRSISKRSKSCIKNLLDLIDHLEDPDDINQRNCLHRYLVSLNRTQQNETNGETNGTLPNAARAASQYITPAAPPIVSSPYPSKETDDSTLSGFADEAVKLLTYILDCLKPNQRRALIAKDNLGRTPLHHAAHYGFAAMCKVIVARMKQWTQFEIDLGIHAPWLRDAESMTPIHLAVIGGHPYTTRILLDSLKGASLRSEFIRDSQLGQKFGECLAQAVRADFADIVELLLDSGADINYQDTQGETAVHIAARLSKIKSLAILLSGHAKNPAQLELREKTFDWTPLFFACKEGNVEAVKLLLDAGADAAKPDLGGWTAQEHAALRGHLKIARMLNEHLAQGPPTTNDLGSASMEPVHKANKKEKKEKNANGLHNGNGTTIKTEAVKTFGHRYLTDKSMILVSLGTMDTRKNIPAVDLKQIPVAEAHRTQLDTALSIVVTAEGAEGESEIVDLPVQDNIATEPFTFMTNDVLKTVLHFDVVPTYAGSADKIIGRGSAMLSSVKPSIGSKRMPLQGDIAVPIHAAQTLKIIGTVNFNFLIVHPFSHPNMSLSERSTFWKKTTQAMVIGHRGLGKNMTSRKALQLGENTIQSFISAANLGATYVEFDVQLTKDHVPVIYHDFLVSETGIDAPVHTLTLEQFLHINPEQPPSPQLHATNGDSDKDSNDGHVTRNGRGRAYSAGMGSLLGNDPIQMDERMKYTRDFRSKGFKANSRGKFIQEPFTTLEKMFRTLPKDLSFNIEMKYPMLWESDAEEMDPYAVDLNIFVDTVLKMVYDLSNGRQIIFSSFNPDVCLLLAFKQPSVPVLFLTDAGSSEVGDIRASSLQEAIRFASRWDLLGIVSEASPLVLSPRLISLVKENGLMCISYGSQNNDAAKVQLQEDEGIDAVITDDILQIKKARLTRDLEVSGNGQSRASSADPSTATSPMPTPIAV